MLVITLKAGEFFSIGNDIQIQVVALVEGQGIRIAIKAPSDMKITRPFTRKEPRKKGDK